jgi:opacity protein-like surface antigen
MQILNAAAAVAALAAAAVALPSTAFEGDIRYSYLEGGYQRLDVDNFNGKGNGGFFGGSIQVHESAFLSAGYDFAGLGRGVDVRTLELAAGVRYPMTRDLDAVLQLGYIDGKVDTRFGDFNDDGFFVSAGARWMLTETVELNSAIKYVDLDRSGDDWVFSLGGLIEVRPKIALLGGFEFTDGADILQLGVRYYF